MAKLTLTDITAGHGAAALYNANNALIEAVAENQLSRDGTSPNTMQAVLDMNGFAILNAANFNTDFNLRGNWTTATAYAVGDVVFVLVADSATNGGSSYYCQTAHTSGDFDTDLAAAKWLIVAQRGAVGASGGLDPANNLSDVDSLTTSLNNLITGHGALETADIGDDQITIAKLADGTDGELITWDAAGEATTVAVGTSGQVLTSNGAGAAPTFQAASGGTIATQANMETATSTTTYVTPGRQHFHPGMAKAWVVWNSSATIIASQNVSSVSKTSTGRYTVNFTTPFSSANYCAVVGIEYSFGSTNLSCGVRSGTRLAGSCEGSSERSDETATDAGFYHVAFYGDL
jgi:hypothetical protein